MRFFAKFKRCFYEMANELLDVKTKPTQLGMWQYLDMIYFIFAFRVPFIVFVMYKNYKMPAWYDFRQFDVTVSFLHTFSSTFDYSILLMVYFFDLIYFMLKWWCYRLDVSGRNWRFWYQLTVESVQYYEQCCLSESKIKTLETLKLAKYEERIQKLFPFVGRKLPVGFVLKKLASAEIVYQMEDIDVVKLKNQTIPLMPLLSWKIRSKVLKIILFTENFAYVFQLFLSN